jgi:hemolysin activation/secretion protein
MINKMSRWIIAGIVFELCSLSAYSDEPNPIGHFEITRYQVQGNTLLPEKDIDQLLAPYTGKDRDFGSVEKALEALEAAYRDKGYSIVRVVLPEQELNQGVVTIKVVENKIGKITVSGNKFFTDDNIKNSIPALQIGQTPVMAEVSANVKVANEDPAKKTVVQLQTGDQEGLVNANLKVVDEKKWSGSVAVDNTGDEITGRNRLTVMVQNANVGGWDHVLSMQYTTSFANPNEVSVYGIGYHIPLYVLKDSLDFFASYSNVNSGTVTAGVFDVGVSGSGTAFGTRYNHNLMKIGDYDSTVTLGFDYKIFNNDLTVAGLPLGSNVAVHPLSLTYTGNWTVTGSSANFYATAVQNISGGEDSSDADFAAARTGATPNYSLFRYGANYLRALPQDWQFRFALNGQLTSDALVQGEQFGAGGANSVRGFSEREVIDDKGRTTTLELYTMNLCTGGAQCRVLGFYDTGYVSRNDPLPGEIQRESIGSGGLGFRLTRAPYLLLQADLAHVIDASTVTPKGTNRIQFRVVYTF